jgi:hypothetical protein
MSMIGFAASPGTEVEPMCSIARALAECSGDLCALDLEMLGPCRVVVGDDDVNLLRLADQNRAAGSENRVFALIRTHPSRMPVLVQTR